MPACLGMSAQGTTIAVPRGMNIVARSLTPIAAVLLFLAAAAPAPASAGSPTDQLRSRINRVASALAPGTIAGAALKVYCFPHASDCPDPQLLLAEAVSAGDGTFTVVLPDPGGRP